MKMGTLSKDSQISVPSKFLFAFSVVCAAYYWTSKMLTLVSIVHMHDDSVTTNDRSTFPHNNGREKGLSVSRKPKSASFVYSV